MSASVEGSNDDLERLSKGLRELKDRLERIMARPKATPRDADEASEAAKALADLLRGEQRALRLLEGSAQERPRPPASGATPNSLAGLTLHEAARSVLEDAGWPMHVRDLAVRVKAGAWRNPRGKNATAPQLAQQLAARLPRYPETFRRVAPNTFALTEWGDNPPRKERPKPLIGIIASGGEYAARDIDEELGIIFEDERNQWRSS